MAFITPGPSATKTEGVLREEAWREAELKAAASRPPTPCADPWEQARNERLARLAQPGDGRFQADGGHIPKREDAGAWFWRQSIWRHTAADAFLAEAERLREANP